ncbi:MAG TPA: histidine triad nucleotide-binding protein, partial [Candidatus Lustribacter sp.]|nr:histidine triad nucleotide-binding protein [Candidatus Lustribacter sp.]
MSADPECLFCRIVSGTVPASIIAQTEHSVAFRDINPQAPVHLLVIPRRHIVTVTELAELAPGEAADLCALAGRVARAEGVSDGFRLVANSGATAGQVVFHAHLHVLGGRPMG